MEANQKMAEMPVQKLLLNMGIPMILSMMLQAAYNIVDSAFVANMPRGGEAALNALTLAFPVQMLMVAVAIGTGVGTNALLARTLGQGNRKKASQVAGNGVFLAWIISGLCILFGIIGVRLYISSQTTNEEIFSLAVDYLRICCVVPFGIVFFSLFEKLLQATGRSLYSTIAQVSGAVTNIIFDPILIYGLFGLPALGVRGAAYATVLGQLVSCLVGCFFHLRLNREWEKGISWWRPSWRIIREIYSIGLPAIIAQSLMSVMTYALNLIFVRIDEAVVTAYGLYYKIQQFVLFAAFGLRDAITPVLSFNYGRGDGKRVKDSIRWGMRYTVIIMVAGLILVEALANPLAHVFGLSGLTERLCIQAIRIVSLSFLFAGINVAFQGIFQALDCGIESLVLSLLRQVVVILPIAWWFSCVAMKDAALTGLVWWSFLIAEAVTATVAWWMMRRIRTNRISTLIG